MSKKIVLALSLITLTSSPAWARGKVSFQEMDLNKNGLISQKEMFKTMSQRFKMADKNKDQIITPEEVLAMMPMLVRPMASSKVTKYLKTRDLNKDGKTHMNEIKTYAKNKFKVADKNSDGKLSKAEFEAFQKANG